MRKTGLRDDEAFDAFYAETRDRLALQAFALTGDLKAARSGVRDAFVSAHHHWRKFSRSEDPESRVRQRALSAAQRIATARVWHKTSREDPEAFSTLEALAALDSDERRLLVMATLSGATADRYVREVGIPLARSEEILARAQATYSDRRGVSVEEIPDSFAPLTRAVAEIRWPRITIIKRAGNARRRTHTLAGVLGIAATLVISGAIVTQNGDTRPALASPAGPDEQVNEVVGHNERLAGGDLDPATLVRTADLRILAPRRAWAEPSVADSAPRSLPPCWLEPAGDPAAEDVVSSVAVADPTRRRGNIPARGRLEARQVIERSATEDDASNAFETILNWHSTCGLPRMQLVSVQEAPRIGDQAAVITLKQWHRNPSLITVALGRTGRLGTSILTQSTSGPAVPARSALRVLARSIDRLCTDPAGGRCARGPDLRPIPPLPVGEAPGLLSEIDLPGVVGIQRPWIGTDPEPASFNYAATGCARANFLHQSMSNKLTRSFVIPDESLPSTFGITETAASLPDSAGRRWLSDTRSRISQCVEGRLGTEMTLLTNRRSPAEELAVWRVTTELSDTRSVRYYMALMRNQDAVAQIGFIQRPNQMTPAPEFTALAERALTRLARMPKPKAPKKRAGGSNSN